MTTRTAFVALLLFSTACASAATIVYHDEASFLAAITPGSYLEDFGAYTDGGYQQPTLPLGPVNGFSYTISAGPNGTLYSLNSAMSTEESADKLSVTPGAGIWAVGGIFYPTNVSGQTMPGNIVVALNDGTTETLVNPTPTTFVGFLSSAPLTLMTIDSPDDGGVFRYAAMDHFYVAAPEPASLALLGLAGLALRRR